MELKKNEKYDLENKRGLFFNIGLVTVLAVVFLAFEWRSYETGPMDLGPLNLDDIEEEIIPITQQNQPPPPPPPQPKVQEVLNIVEDDEEIEEELEIEDSEADEDTEIEIMEVEEVVEEDEIFTIVEDMPVFPGGEAGLMTYLQKNIKYPEMAKEAGIQGTVYVSFVVGRDGKVRDAKILRGIAGGKACDKEALRVVNAMPSWTPGKQRGKAVSVNYNLPVRFLLR